MYYLSETCLTAYSFSIKSVGTSEKEYWKCEYGWTEI